MAAAGKANASRERGFALIVNFGRAFSSVSARPVRFHPLGLPTPHGQTTRDTPTSEIHPGSRRTMIRRCFLLAAPPALLAIHSIAARRSRGPPRPCRSASLPPTFQLPGVDGKTYQLKDFADAKVLVVIFTCNHCPTAQAYEARVAKLTTDYKSKGVAVVAISPNDAEAVRLDELGYTDLGDSFDDMKVRAKDHKYPYPYLYDGETQAVAIAYGVLATPHVRVRCRAKAPLRRPVR